MTRIIAVGNIPRKVNRKSYRPSTPFGYGILLPPATARLAPITPSQLAAEIKGLLASSQELGRRQDALLASLRSSLAPIAGGSPEATDKDLDALYEESRWIDRVAETHRDPADLLL
jgi:hypothetical protein